MPDSTDTAPAVAVNNGSQTIFKITRRTNPFVMIDKNVLEDARLSWRAKGLLCYLLSRPDNWKVILGDLTNRSTEGREAVQRALADLKELGYARLVTNKEAGRGGKMIGKTWHVWEVPNADGAKFDAEGNLLIELPIPPLPADEGLSRPSGKPSDGNPTSTNKDITKKKSGEDLSGVPIPDHLCTELFYSAWNAFLDARRARKVPVTAQAARMLFEHKFKGFTVDEVVEAIRDSIANGWRGVFPKHTNGANRKPDGRGFTQRNPYDAV